MKDFTHLWKSLFTKVISDFLYLLFFQYEFHLFSEKNSRRAIEHMKILFCLISMKNAWLLPLLISSLIS